MLKERATQKVAVPVLCKAVVRSGGRVSASTSVRKYHGPLALAAAIFAVPAGVIAAMVRALATWALLIADQADPGCRAVIRIIERSAFSALVTKSIKPRKRSSWVIGSQGQG